MIVLEQPARSTQSSPVRWGLEWFLAIATFTIIAHGFGCHGDDIDHEPTIIIESNNNEPRP